MQAPEIGVVVSGDVDGPDRAGRSHQAAEALLAANFCQGILRRNASLALLRRHTRRRADGRLQVAFAACIPIDEVVFFYSRHHPKMPRKPTGRPLPSSLYEHDELRSAPSPAQIVQVLIAGRDAREWVGGLVVLDDVVLDAGLVGVRKNLFPVDDATAHRRQVLQ